MPQLLFYFITYLTIVFAIALLLKKNRHSTDILLAVWSIFLSSVYSVGNHVDNWEVCVTFIQCVFLYLYVKCLTLQVSFEPKYLLHFVPFVLSILVAIFYPEIMHRHFVPAYTVMVLFTVVYFSATIKLIIVYRKNNKSNTTTEYSLSLSWLYLLVSATIIGHVIKIVPTILLYMNGRQMNIMLINIVVMVLLNVIGFKAVRMNLTFFKKNKISKPASYSTYNLEESEINALQQRLVHLMEVEKLYLNPELTLKDISGRLNISSHNLSFLLNTKFNLNFYEFVNNYRLDTVKNELINPQKKHYAIFAIACDCGFNSQSTFNRIFKQKVGVSPSQYRDQHLVATRNLG